MLDADQAKLYELIWLRAVASQMESAELERTTVDIAAKVAARLLDLRATGTVIKFDGFLKLYQEGRDDDPGGRGVPPPARHERGRAADQEGDHRDPAFHRAAAALFGGLPGQAHGGARHRPARRPMRRSCRCCKDRNYVRIDKRRLVPEDSGRIVIAFLESFFARYVEYDFTADLEEQLDRVSNNELDWRELLREFWRDFTAAVGEIKDLRISQVIDALDEMLAPHIFPPRADGVDPRHCPTCGTGRLSLKLGKFGAFIGCSNYPECRFTRPFSVPGADGAEETATQGARAAIPHRPRGHAAQRPLRPLCAARRGGGRREAQARQPAARALTPPTSTSRWR